MPSPPSASPGGATYSWGAAYIGLETGQMSIYGLGNGQMWQYAGAELPPYPAASAT